MTKANIVEKKGERVIKKLVSAYDDIFAAQEALWKAKAELADLWDDNLVHEFYGSDLPERVIVRNGAHLYEIKFDVDNWGVPDVQRIDRYAAFREIEAA